MKYFPKKMANQTILLYVLLLIVLALIYPTKRLDFQWIFFGLFAVVFFFYLSAKLTKKWFDLPEKIFLKKVFWLALILRLLWVVFSYYYFIWMTGQPFEFLARDSLTYHKSAIWLVNLYNSNQLWRYFLFLKGYSDTGYSVFLSILYLFFGVNIVIPRIVNALLGSWMVLLVYRLAKRNFGESCAKIAAVFTVMMPILIYYTGLHLKETLMIFVLVYFVELGDLLIREHKLTDGFLVFKLVLLILYLFCFRTVLGLAALFSFFVGLTFNSYRKSKLPARIIKLGFFFLIFSFFTTTTLKLEILENYASRSTNISRRMKMYVYKGNKLAKYGKKSVFFPIILIVPFPSIVDTGQYNLHMTNGALFVRNILAFFVFVGVLTIWIRKRIRKHLLLIFILGSYLSILAISGFALSPRFHLPAIPFIIILASYGIVSLKPIHKNFYPLYLFLIFALIIAWNTIKLLGRGLI